MCSEYCVVCLYKVYIKLLITLSFIQMSKILAFKLKKKKFKLFHITSHDLRYVFNSIIIHSTTCIYSKHNTAQLILETKTFNSIINMTDIW